MIGQIIENKDTAFVGDIVQNKVQISQQNIDFIMNILTSNLYSKPLESFFREIISNAYDAQVEAGNPDHPIIMLLEQGDTYNTIRISIRDWGTGISPERFDEVYKYLGTSTKRESNEFIGYFGIGKFSVLSLTDTCVINSYYNNVKHSYLMYKNDMSINIDKVGEFKGDFENGLEVSVTLNNLTVSTFNEALQKMAFFENLHVVIKDLPYYQSSADTFNKRVINHYENFSTCDTILRQDCVLIGRVIYQYKEFESYKTKGGYYFPRIPIGSVMVTPNRENILLTSDATALIEDAISKSKKEIENLAREIAISKNYNTFEEFYKDAVSYIRICNGYYKYNDFPMMIRGRKILPATINTLINVGINSNNIPSFTKKVASRYDLSIANILAGRVKVFIKAERTLQAVTKAWLESENDNFIVISDNVVQAFKDNLEFASRFVTYKNRLKDVFMEYLKRYLSYTVVSNNDVPEKFRNSFFDKRNYFDKSVKTLENSKIRLYNNYGYALHSWNSIKGLKGLIVYDVHTKDDSLIKEFCPTYNNYTSIVNKIHFITVSKECYNAMPKNRKFMDFLTFMSNKNNFYAKIVTSHMITENYYHLDSYKYGMTKRNSFNNSRLRRFREYSLSSTVVDLYKANKWYDECALREYLYTDEEIKVLQEVSKLERSKDAILESAIYNKFKSVKFLNLKKPKVYFKDCNV